MTDPYLCSCSTPLLLQVKADLERHEGFREFAYPDPLSKIARRYKHLPWGYKSARELLALVTDLNEEDGKPWTYGFGFTSKVTPDGRISRQMAERKLEEHILQMDALLSSKLSWYKDASNVTKSVLINMAFNMGIYGLLSFKNTLKFIAAKNYEQAASNMKLSLWYRQVGSRAKELVARMATQTIPAEYKAPERI
jgi:Phage lysozyme.